MTDGFVLPRGGGDQIGVGSLGVVLKAGARHAAAASTFETIVAPGFDVGAHLHRAAEESFYVLEGELDLLAFEPRVRAEGDWRAWESPDGRKVMRAGPGCFMYVPPGCPHAFMNPGPGPARVLFHVSPAGHERYFRQLADHLMRGGRPDSVVLDDLRRRHDIEQLTRLGSRRLTA